MFSKDATALVALLLVIFIRPSKACNGYTLKVNRVKNCIENSVIKVENGDASLDKDCNLILKGCLNFPKGFKTAKGKYVLKKAPMPPMDGELDFCDAVSGLDDPQIVNVAKMYNMPSKCPIPPGKACGDPNKKISISKFKNQLGIAAGTIDLKLDVDHDTGKTCIDINLTLSKARARG
ncbi:uncharacterized protein LOC662471 [Tribolium castaneum]|uniref:MD-2-related lipid-recognition domain-containing protein n=1 Tax=Tribolium castaneum TaxID=7070 RepID=D2A0Z0_TRICA|nr:PREDICTED: uncharacterized protein LOC662471 [Tribolium castaneum]EFA01608.1 hypothetical protein TcasGA2_TC007174 [Tribolium castaneum]|eukprot:XP_973656.1 PREDICTED: uncharacterized protein LOC662471 [Tribolium castaneum]